MIRKIRQ